MSEKPGRRPKPRSSPRASRIIGLVKPHLKSLVLAFAAVLGEALTDILEPRPIRIVTDSIQHSRTLPELVGRMVAGIFGQGPSAVPGFAVAAPGVMTLTGQGRGATACDEPL